VACRDPTDDKFLELARRLRAGSGALSMTTPNRNYEPPVPLSPDEQAGVVLTKKPAPAISSDHLR